MKTWVTTTVAMAILLGGLACTKSPSNSASTATSQETLANSNNPDEKAPFADKKTASGAMAVVKTDEPAPAAERAPERQTLTIPAGTTITVRLQNAVSSETSNTGDRFEAVLDAPIVVEGHTLAKAGTAVTGRVVAVNKSGHLKNPGMIQLALSSIAINGREVGVNSSSVIAKGASHKKRNWAMIGGGAGGGALLGGLVGGGKGAVIGSAVGAGAGTTAAYATGEKNVGFGVERRLTFRLRDSLTVKS